MNIGPQRFETAESEELLGSVANGDIQAFSALYDRFSSPLYSVALAILKNQAEAEEVLQDVLTQVWKQAHRFDRSQGKPLTWAVTLTRNRAIDRLRRSQRYHQARDHLKDRGDDEQQSQTPSDELLDKETANSVRSALTRLPKEQREVLELTFLSGMTQQEAAEKLQLPLGTVKARIRRGMLRLRELLKTVL